MLRTGFTNLQQKMVTRAFSCSPVTSSKDWRASKGLALNKNAEGILTDGPDYTFLDGRPTPLLHKQKQRMQKQQGYATKIVEMCSELEFAKQRHQNMIRAKEDERDTIIQNRLKPKGSALEKRK